MRFCSSRRDAVDALAVVIAVVGVIVTSVLAPASAQSSTPTVSVPITPASKASPLPVLRPEERRQRQDWHLRMARTPRPKKGCFTAAFPNTGWKEVPCTAPPAYPQPPRHGGRPQTVGNNNDVSAQVPPGFNIALAVGSFDNAIGITSESGLIDNKGKAVANAYTLQLNTDFFVSKVACKGSPNGNCRGWEQFVFENDGSSGRGYIQYWLIQYNADCPAGAGWNQTTLPGSTDIYCWKNSKGAVSIPAQAATNLGQLSVIGEVAPNSDGITVSDGTNAYSAAGDNLVDAAAGWQIAEFNVFGDGGSGQANFNSGASIVTRIRLVFNGGGAPTCSAQGFTGETNNLNFGPRAPAASPPGPAIVFTESSAGGAVSNCAAAAAVAGIHGTWTLAGNTSGFGQVADGRPFWVGNFDGQGGTDLLFYYKGDKNWWLGRFDGAGALTWKLAGNTAGFGQVADGRPFWTGDFTGQGKTDILFYYPGDKNWWLGRFDGAGAMTWKLAGNTAGFGQVADGRPFYTGNFDGQGGDDILFYYPGDKNWWLGRFDGNGNLTWKLAGNTAGFGQVADGRPFWVGNFDGQGGTDLLFYFKGDKNWWLGRFDGSGALNWKLAANTAGFGQVADGRPFWTGNFDGQGGDDILFYYPGDKNWWLGRFNGGGTLTWNLAANTAGFGQVADGRPFWTGGFSGRSNTDIMFYYPGDKNWWLGQFSGAGALSWVLADNTIGFGQVADGRPFWTGDFDGQGGTDILFYYPGDKNWWLGRFLQ